MYYVQYYSDRISQIGQQLCKDSSEKKGFFCGGGPLRVLGIQSLKRQMFEEVGAKIQERLPKKRNKIKEPIYVWHARKVR